MASAKQRLRMLKISCKKVASEYLSSVRQTANQIISTDLCKFQYTNTLMTSHTFTDRPHLPVQRCKMLKNEMLVHNQTSFVCCTGVEISPFKRKPHAALLVGMQS